MRLPRIVSGIGLTALGCLLAAAPAAARDAVVTSFDGTSIATSFFPAEGLAPGQRAPTVLVGHGWGQSRDTNPDSASDDLFGQVGLGPLRRAGFNVLSWDARGWGQSNGTVEVDSKDFEGRDVQALVDFVAGQPEARLDGPNDPRVGMSGVSYGGGIQLVSAGLDRRIDAITPTIAWNALTSSLYKEQTVKGGWGSVLVGAAASRPSVDSHVFSAYASGTATGKVSADDEAFFVSRATAPLVGRVRVPTLLVQGTADTLFTLPEAIRNYAILHRNGVPLKMLWFCGGHGVCLTSKGPGGRVEQDVVAWLKRYLGQNRAVDVGPSFEWIADDGLLRSGGDYPLPTKGALTGSGSGTLPLAAGSSASGGAIIASPTASPVDVPIRNPATAQDVVGEPSLTLRYTGTASPAATVVFAQIVDGRRNVVLGNQVTPIPVVLDGQPHTVTRPLEGVAAHVSPDSQYRLQIIDGTNVYGPQRSSGAVTMSAIAVSLPVADPRFVVIGARVPSPCAGMSTAPARRTRGRRLALTLARLGGRARDYRTRRSTRVLTCGASGRLRSVRLTLRDSGGNVIGRSLATSVRGRRRLRIRFRRGRHIAAGGYTLEATGRNPDRRAARLAVGVRFR
ncbi:MAG TPA: CocE/NonD family hydrolase [Solirubrobacteraceae bacterium]|nr:CocE/NonD family hydrolase [Solirubrobacteraceae bacterium]